MYEFVHHCTLSYGNAQGRIVTHCASDLRKRMECEVACSFGTYDEQGAARPSESDARASSGDAQPGAVLATPSLRSGPGRDPAESVTRIPEFVTEVAVDQYLRNATRPEKSKCPG